MRLTVTLILVVALSGCAVQLGKITPGGEPSGQQCSGLYVSLGQTTGPCGMVGGEISDPGAGLVGAALKAAADLAGMLLGRSQIVIQPAVAE